MRLGLPRPLSLSLLTSLLLWSAAHSSPTGSSSLSIDVSRGLPESGPPLSTRALPDKSYLPAQIGGIVAAYGVSLVLVAITLLSLAKKRREHLEVEEEIDYAFQPQYAGPLLQQFQDNLVSSRQSEVPSFPHLSIPKSEYSNGPFSSRPLSNGTTPYIVPSPSSPISSVPGVEPLVDQTIVAADRAMAQQQLEEMYKHVMEHEDAKLKGIVLDAPVIPPSSQRTSAVSERSGGILSKKGKSKPSSLNLSATKEEKSQSRASSILALLSPKKKSVKGINISSPIMTPMSGTFPRQESQEMNTIPPRHYAPPPPPPVPTDQVPFGAVNTRASGAPLTPDFSPESIQSIDERIGLQLDRANQSRSTLNPPTERDPESATSEHSQAPLIGLPSSPKPGSRFPSLPSSPKPGATFHRSNTPSAVRTNGTLPLRAYEEELGSPSVMSHVTKQTVFERKGPLSPGGGRTPFTASAVPYSPYQPYTPCIPITPSLVTKEDRRKMKRMVPKTPTLEMVKSSDEIW